MHPRCHIPGTHSLQVPELCGLYLPKTWGLIHLFIQHLFTEHPSNATCRARTEPRTRQAWFLPSRNITVEHNGIGWGCRGGTSDSGASASPVGSGKASEKQTWKLRTE